VIKAESGGVGYNGLFNIPAGIRNQQGIIGGSVMLECNWKGSKLLIPTGAEILLVDLLVENSSLVTDAQSLRFGRNKEYSSPLTIFRRKKFSNPPSLIVGSRAVGRRMTVCAIGEGGVMVIKGDDPKDVKRAYATLPDNTELWVRKPEVSPLALLDAYQKWIREHGSEILEALDHQTTVTPVAERNKGLNELVLLNVKSNIVDFAQSQITKQINAFS
jgi:hypothetical protein